MSTGNTKYGNSALASNYKKNGNNSAFGIDALRDSTNQNNTAVGAYSGTLTTTGESNVSVGTNALLKNKVGSYNTALGTATMCFNESGTNNTAVGSNALEYNKANYNTAVGAGAMFTNTDGIRNTTVGYQALYSNTTGNDNIAIGETSLYGNKDTNNNTAIGRGSLQSNTGNENTAIGHYSLGRKSSGDGNVGIGPYTLGFGSTNPNTGSDNVAVGRYALNKISGATSNLTAVGAYALEKNTSGTNNTGLGYRVLHSNEIGTNNTALGYQAGSSTAATGSYNTFLGANTDVSGNSISNSTAIGYNSKVTANNQIMMGTSEQVVIPGSAVLTNTNPNSYSQSTSIVPKSYVDSVAGGLTPTTACKCATTGTITLSGLQTIDYLYTTNDGDRVLVKSQGATYINENTLNTANGIYIARTGAWTRATDCALGQNVTGQLCFIEDGSYNNLTAFSQISNPGIVGTNALQYTIFYSTNFEAGQGLDISGNQLIVLPQLSNFLTFVGINGGTSSTNYSLDSGTKDILVNGLTVGKGPGTGTGNTTFGYQALTNSSGVDNTAIGYQALNLNSTGQYNVAIGFQALQNNNNTDSNVAIGTGALQQNTGADNIAIGTGALQQNTGADNIAIGTHALQKKIAGNTNIAIGSASLASIGLSGNSNIGIGQSTLNVLTGNVSSNIAIGYESGKNVSSGANNTLLGYQAGQNITTTSNNTFLGYQADIDISSNLISNSTAIGYNAKATASNQIMLGGKNSSNNYPNVKIPGTLDVSGNAIVRGKMSAFDNVTTTQGAFTYGTSSGDITEGTILSSDGNTTEIKMNDAGGSHFTLSNSNKYLNINDTSANQNPYTSGLTLISISSANNRTVGIVGIGKQANTSYALDVSGNTNVSGTLGVTSDLSVNTNKFTVTAASGNTSVAGTLGVTGNVGIGKASGLSYALDVSGNTNMSGTLGVTSDLTINTNKFTVTASSGNTSIAGTLGVTSDLKVASTKFTVTAASGNTSIAGTLGVTSDLSVNTNKFTVTGASGNTSVAGTLGVTGTTTMTGNVGIGKASGSSYALDVSGNVQATSFNATSDYRIKENVSPIDSKFTIDNLRPVTYINKMSGSQDIGFIAHELQEYFPFLVKGEKDGEENQSVNYIGLIAVLVKEIQELKKKIN